MEQQAEIHHYEQVPQVNVEKLLCQQAATDICDKSSSASIAQHEGKGRYEQAETYEKVAMYEMIILYMYERI